MSIARSFRTAAVLASLVALPLGGCIKMNQSNVLEKDGTGMVTVTFSMDKQKMKEMQEMAKAFGGQEGEEGGGMDDLGEQMDPEKMKKELEGKEGIEVVSAEKIDDEKTVGAKMVVKYKTLEHYFKAGIGGLGDNGMKVTLEEKDGVWTLTQETEGGGMGDMGDMGGEEMPEFVKAMFAGLDIGFSIQLPGSVTETNGTKNEAGNTVSWKMTEKDVGNKEAMKAFSKMTVSFKGDGLGLKAFSLVTEGDKDEAEETIEEPAGK